MRVKSNGHIREIVYGCELSDKERAEFDYYSTFELETASFVRAYGNVYDLGEFSATWGISRDGGLPEWLAGWDGFLSESYWTGILVRFTEDCEHVVVGHYLSES